MWAVVLELDGCEPQLIGESPKREAAQDMALALAALHQKTGGRVTCSKTESTDQLQRYGKGGSKFHRDQPDKPAVGQDTIVFVPTAHHSIKVR